MEVAGGKSKGEGRHSLLRSSLLSHRRWWIAPGGEGVGNFPSVWLRWAGRGAAPLLVFLLLSAPCTEAAPLPQAGQGISLFLSWSAQVGTDRCRRLQHPCSPACLEPAMSRVQHTHLCWQHSISAAQTSPSACACPLLALLDASQIPSFCHNSSWSSTTCPLIAAVSVISHAVFTCLLITCHQSSVMKNKHTKYLAGVTVSCRIYIIWNLPII